jgi:hypothetical protein
MTAALAARAAYKQAEVDARLMTARARARLGRAVEQEHAKGTSYEDISDEFGVVIEQIRRYRQAYRDWSRDHPGESLD